MKFKLDIEGGCWGFDTPESIEEWAKPLEKWGFTVLRGEAAYRNNDAYEYRATDHGDIPDEHGNIKWRITGDSEIDLTSIDMLQELRKDVGTLIFRDDEGENVIILDDIG